MKSKQRDPFVVLHAEIPPDLDRDLEAHRVALSARIGEELTRSAATRVILRRGLDAIAREAAK